MRQQKHALDVMKSKQTAETQDLERRHSSMAAEVCVCVCVGIGAYR